MTKTKEEQPYDPVYEAKVQSNLEWMREDLAKAGLLTHSKLCSDCGATYDPTKGSCGCHDNGAQ